MSTTRSPLLAVFNSVFPLQRNCDAIKSIIHCWQMHWRTVDILHSSFVIYLYAVRYYVNHHCLFQCVPACRPGLNDAGRQWPIFTRSSILSYISLFKLVPHTFRSKTYTLFSLKRSHSEQEFTGETCFLLLYRKIQGLLVTINLRFCRALT